MAEEMVKENHVSSYNVYRCRFGSIKNVCDLLNIEYFRNYGIGTVCYDKIGNLCKSRAECLISNFFIEHNIEFSKEPQYKELIKDVRKRKFDWKIKINNCWYYVEYFGVFDVNSKSKIVKNYTIKAKKKMRDLYKAGVINKCILIFPNDIINTTSETFDMSLKNLLLNRYSFDLEKVS
jgi:hypothetical protein